MAWPSSIGLAPFAAPARWVCSAEEGDGPGFERALAALLVRPPIWIYFSGTRGALALLSLAAGLSCGWCTLMPAGSLLSSCWSGSVLLPGLAGLAYSLLRTAIPRNRPLWLWSWLAVLVALRYSPAGWEARARFCPRDGPWRPEERRSGEADESPVLRASESCLTGATRESFAARRGLIVLLASSGWTISGSGASRRPCARLTVARPGSTGSPGRPLYREPALPLVEPGLVGAAAPVFR